LLEAGISDDLLKGVQEDSSQGKPGTLDRIVHFYKICKKKAAAVVEIQGRIARVILYRVEFFLRRSPSEGFLFK